MYWTHSILGCILKIQLKILKGVNTLTANILFMNGTYTRVNHIIDISFEGDLIIYHCKGGEEYIINSNQTKYIFHNERSERE